MGRGESDFKGPVYRDTGSRLRTDLSPLFLTYFMLDWGNVSQSASAMNCISCGGAMMLVEPVRDKKGTIFEGVVCHGCKRVIWTRKG